MKLILKDRLEGLGDIGDVVNVKKGYARNFLLPKSLAVIANEKNQKWWSHYRGILLKKQKQSLESAKQLVEQIEKISVTITKPVGENDRIFGTVTTTELEALLKKEGYMTISKKDIIILDEIKHVGVYNAEVRLYKDIRAKFKIWVVSES